MLEISLERDPQPAAKSFRAASDDTASDVSRLAKLGNELRVSGRLLQATEAFRRAVALRPTDARALLDMSKCLRALAHIRGDGDLDRRASAMMRLCERRAEQDVDLLLALGECYCLYGDWRRARIVFQRATDRFGGSVRSLVGLAEVALRDGKLAHAVMNFAEAYRMAGSAPLRRRVRSEMEYFSRLSDDDEYQQLEISRVNLLDSLTAIRSSATRITLFGCGVTAVGLILDLAAICDIGWVVSGIAIVVWLVVNVLRRLFSERIAIDAVNE